MDQPSVDDTIAILRGLKEKIEIHHAVRIKDAAIVAAAVLSDRYITDRFLPDKAIDLIDEAGSALRLQIGSMPIEIDQIERRVSHLEIERQALNREKDSDQPGTAASRGRRIGAAARRVGRPEGALGAGEDCHPTGPLSEGSSRNRPVSTKSGPRVRANGRRLPSCDTASWPRSSVNSKRPIAPWKLSRAIRRSSKKRLTKKISRRLWRSGPAYRFPGCWKARSRS